MARLLSALFVNFLLVAWLSPYAIAAPQGSVDLAATAIPTATEVPEVSEDVTTEAGEDLAASTVAEVAEPAEATATLEAAPADTETPEEDDGDGDDDDDDDEEASATLTSAESSAADEVVKATATVVPIDVDGNDTTASSISLDIPLLPANGTNGNTTDAKQLMDAELNHALPSILHQLEVPDDEINSTVAEGTPLIEEALKAMFSGQDLDGDDLDETTGLTRRGILSDIGNWVKKTAKKVGKKIKDTVTKPIKQVKKAACDVFASATLPGYLTFAKVFRIQNRNGKAISRDHKFFLYPIHRALLRSHKIRVHWKADFPIGFGSADGATFGRQVYIRGHELKAKDGITDAFRVQSRLLIHELVHCKQYRHYGWNLAKFGMKYLKEYCLAGFKYKKNKLEDEAYKIQDDVNGLLNDNVGNQFFSVWRKNDLFKHLRYPTHAKYTRVGNVSRIGNVWQLVFEKGVLQISGRGCFRWGTRSKVGRKQFTCPT